MIEVLRAEFEEEAEQTRRILALVPDTKLSWAPHARSMTLGRLAQHIAEIPFGLTALLREAIGEFPGGSTPPPTSTAEILDLFDKGVALTRSTLAEWDNEDLKREWMFRAGGITLLRSLRGEAVRKLLFSHLIHHRAQLSVYLRLLDVPIPGFYGPSADDMAARASAD